MWQRYFLYTHWYKKDYLGRDLAVCNGHLRRPFPVAFEGSEKFEQRRCPQCEHWVFKHKLEIALKGLLK